MIDEVVDRIEALCGGHLKPNVREEVRMVVAGYAVAAYHDTKLQTEAWTAKTGAPRTDKM